MHPGRFAHTESVDPMQGLGDGGLQLGGSVGHHLHHRVDPGAVLLHELPGGAGGAAHLPQPHPHLRHQLLQGLGVVHSRGHLAILIDEALQGEDDCKVLPGVADHHGVADHLLHSGAAASPRSQGPP